MYRAATEEQQQQKKQVPDEEDDISESWLKEAAAREPHRARDRERGSGPGGGTEEPEPAPRRGKLRNGIEWCRRHLRFLGPGLIASAA